VGEGVGGREGTAHSRWCTERRPLTNSTAPRTARNTQLPSVAEAALGEVLYQKFLAEQAAKRALLDKTHPDTLLVTGVAQRLIAALAGGHGGGYQKHLRSFRWEVAVVNQGVMNAFVFPGGKIVVYTGLLQLLRRDPDLLAMVMG
jgi:predicted Zn-dependent protease